MSSTIKTSQGTILAPPTKGKLRPAFILCLLSPFASYILSLCLRFVDGFLSLTVNAVVLFHATSVFSMFLNFAALHFLQSIDDIIHELCIKGFFGNRIEETAKLSKDFQLPARRDDHWMRCSDSVGLFLILVGLIAIWVWFLVDPPAVAHI